ncbi:MAG: DUF721 domain-containing protein [Candidatus Marinimicrobia bacterium]|nr:DUF721 domain-containing protein [Candidatus Neomarinimicrobiota bacterium]
MEELKKSIEILLKNVGIEIPILQNKALLIWENVVGTLISKNTLPEEVKHGILFVKTATPVWRNELIMKKEEIIKNLNKAIGKKVIKDIRFI